MLAQPARFQVDRVFVVNDFGLSIWCLVFVAFLDVCGCLWILLVFVDVCKCFLGVCGCLRVFVAALRTLPGSSWRIVEMVRWPEH